MERFFNKVDKTESCWIWNASLRYGYGAFKINGKVVGAHRFSWEYHFGKINNGLNVCHKCDNPKCVNPQHLFLGSNSDNMKDCYKKGRMKIPIASRFKKGYKPKNRKLNTFQVEIIKEHINNKKVSLVEISKITNIPYQTIRDISCGRIYKQ